MKVVVPFAGFISLLALGLLASGCAAVAPLTSAITGAAPETGVDVRTQTAVRLEEGNFVTVRTNVVGSSKGFKLLGFITLYPATLDKAMNRLYANAEAREGRPETFAHLIIEHSGIYVILFSIPKVTARADLIEFVPAQSDEENNSRAFGLRPVRQRRHSM
jgi:hypothetical protein